jgi:predicted nucleic acid-binding protein
MTFVIDASMAAAWVLPDEHAPAAEAILQQLIGTGAYVPSLFWYEARSIVLTAERRGRIAPGEALLSMVRLRLLPLDDAGTGRDDIVLAHAARHGLSAYYGAYLALAIKRALPLATLDQKLAAAARTEKVGLLGPLAGP